MPREKPTLVATCSSRALLLLLPKSLQEGTCDYALSQAFLGAMKAQAILILYSVDKGQKPNPFCRWHARHGDESVNILPLHSRTPLVDVIEGVPDQYSRLKVLVIL